MNPINALIEELKTQAKLAGANAATAVGDHEAECALIGAYGRNVRAVTEAKDFPGSRERLITLLNKVTTDSFNAAEPHRHYFDWLTGSDGEFLERCRCGVERQGWTLP